MRKHSNLGRLVAIAVVTMTTAAVSVSAPAGAATRPGAAAVEVQTYNMDFAGDLSRLLTTDDPVAATTAIWAEMVASDIPQRAAGVADEIASRRPDVVGLQEVSVWRSAPYADPTAMTVRYDALQSLLDALEAHGTPYDVVAVGQGFTNEAMPMPFVDASGLNLAVMSDRNVILVRRAAVQQHRMSVANAQSHTFQVLLSLPLAYGTFTSVRSWSTVDVTVRGRTFRFANTHLEAWGFPPLKDQVRNPQAMELAAALAESPYPVVLVGDINSRPTMCAEYRPGSDEYVLDQNVVAYGILQSAGLTEVWPALHRTDPCSPAGWTSGDRALDASSGTLTHRIDDVFFSAGVTAVTAKVVGNRASDRTTPDGFWPSDHASTWAKLLVR